MASRAVEKEKLSSLLLAKSLYFVFIIFILKAKSTIWWCLQVARTFVNHRTPYLLYTVLYAAFSFCINSLIASHSEILFCNDCFATAKVSLHF
jgi:ACR3 family arsenite efflux pump ArsB